MFPITECVVGASSTICTQSLASTSFDGLLYPTYYDWLIMNMFILFIISFLGIGYWFSEFKEGRKIK